VGRRGASRIGGGWVKVHVFFEGVREGTAFQVHVVEEKAPDSRMLITFRDYLREHRTRLAGTKRSRTSLPKNTSDGDAYAKAKTLICVGGRTPSGVATGVADPGA